MIKQFQDQYRFLSNFWPAKLDFGEFVFPTVEHAYQAAKSNDPYDWERILQCDTPAKAKRAGRYVKLRPDFDAVKIDLMTEFVTMKFEDSELRRHLLMTGNQPLQEGNYWGDKFWGVCLKTNQGQNHLGRILMSIRDDLLNS